MSREMDSIAEDMKCLHVKGRERKAAFISRSKIENGQQRTIEVQNKISERVSMKIQLYAILF